LLLYDCGGIGDRGPVVRRKLRGFLQNKGIGRQRPGEHDGVGGGHGDVQLGHGGRERDDIEHGVEAVLLIGRDAHFDVRESGRVCDQSAVEVFDPAAVELKIKRELLLHDTVAAGFVGAAAGHGRGPGVIGEAPLHAGDGEAVKNAVKTGGREEEGPPHRFGNHDRAHAGTEAPLQETAIGFEPVEGSARNIRGLRRGGDYGQDESQKQRDAKSRDNPEPQEGQVHIYRLLNPCRADVKQFLVKRKSR
jgi:hypothetical protein